MNLSGKKRECERHGHWNCVKTRPSHTGKKLYSFL